MHNPPTLSGTPGRFRTVELSDPRWERDGLRQVTVKSAALGQRVDVSVFASEGVEGASEVPVVILLHGVYGSHWAWALKGGAHHTAQRLVRAGAIPPMVLAMPSDGLWGDGSGYLPHRIQDFERWIVEEVPEVVRHAVPSANENAPLCIAGLSMGGMGALRLAGKYPGRFRAASGHSSATRFEQLRTVVEERLASYTALEEDYSVLDALLRNQGKLPPIRFDCGRGDWLLEANRELHRALETAGVAHTYEEFEGGHDWAYWERHLEDSLRFFGEVLRGR
ncbi:MAG: Endo,4-beta-xylanase precursor [Verrucomicrobiota bacterium]|jgi:putative tributyrin esterase